MVLVAFVTDAPTPDAPSAGASASGCAPPSRSEHDVRQYASRQVFQTVGLVLVQIWGRDSDDPFPGLEQEEAEYECRAMRVLTPA